MHAEIISKEYLKYIIPDLEKSENSFWIFEFSSAPNIRLRVSQEESEISSWFSHFNSKISLVYFPF